jgi:hypothetical protein
MSSIDRAFIKILFMLDVNTKNGPQAAILKEFKNLKIMFINGHSNHTFVCNIKKIIYGILVKILLTVSWPDTQG